MNRAALLRIAAAVFGGLAVVAVLAAFVRMGAATSGRSWPMAGEAGWVVPLVAGATVGVLSWLLLGGDYAPEASETGPHRVECPVCGTELLQEWRLCPYCGVKSEKAADDSAACTPNS